MALLRALGFNQASKSYDPKPYEPKARCAHVTGAVNGQCFVFAGRTVDFEKTKEQLPFTVEVFDQHHEDWKTFETTGSPPRGLFGCMSCVSPSGHLYVYGGHNRSQFCGGLYKLSSLKWDRISAESDPDGPMKKCDGGMVYPKKNKIAIVGGHGSPNGPFQPGSLFVRDKRHTDGRGWTNEIHICDIEESKYSVLVNILVCYACIINVCCALTCRYLVLSHCEWFKTTSLCWHHPQQY